MAGENDIIVGIKADSDPFVAALNKATEEFKKFEKAQLETNQTTKENKAGNQANLESIAALTESVKVLLTELAKINEANGFKAITENAKNAKKEVEALAAAAEAAKTKADSGQGKAQTSQAAPAASQITQVNAEVKKGFVASLADVTLVITRVFTLAEQIERFPSLVDKVSKAIKNVTKTSDNVTDSANRILTTYEKITNTVQRFVKFFGSSASEVGKIIDKNLVSGFEKVEAAAEKAKKKAKELNKEVNAAGKDTKLPATEKVQGFTLDLGKLEGAAKKTGIGIGALGATVGVAALAVTGLAVAGGALIGTISTLGDKSIEAAKKQAEQIKVIKDISTATGLTVATTQALATSFELAGLSIDKIQPTIQTLTQTLVSAKSGAAEAQAAFNTFGIDSTNINDVESALKNILANFNNVGDATQRNIAISKIFGEAAVADINKLASKYDFAQREIKKLGIQIDQSGVDAARRFSDANRTLSFTFDALGQIIGNAVLPEIAKATESAAEFVESVVAIPGVIEGFQFLGQTISLTASAAVSLAQSVGTTINVIKIVGEELGITSDIVINSIPGLNLASKAFSLFRNTVQSTAGAFGETKEKIEDTENAGVKGIKSLTEAIDRQKKAIEESNLALTREIELINERTAANLQAIKVENDLAKLRLRTAVNNAEELGKAFIEVDIETGRKRTEILKRQNEEISALTARNATEILTLQKQLQQNLSNEERQNVKTRLDALQDADKRIKENRQKNLDEIQAIEIARKNSAIDLTRATIVEQLAIIDRGKNEQLAIIGELEANLEDQRLKGLVSFEDAQKRKLQLAKSRAAEELAAEIAKSDVITANEKSTSQEIIAAGVAVVEARKRLNDAEVALTANAADQRIAINNNAAAKEIQAAQESLDFKRKLLADIEVLVDTGKRSEIEAARQILDAKIEALIGELNLRRETTEAALKSIDDQIAKNKELKESGEALKALQLERRKIEQESGVEIRAIQNDIARLQAQRKEALEQEIALIQMGVAAYENLAGSVDSVSVASKKGAETIAAFAAEFSNIKFDPNNLKAAEDELARIRGRIAEIEEASRTQFFSGVREVVRAIAEDAAAALGDKIGQERARLRLEEFKKDIENQNRLNNAILAIQTEFQKRLAELQEQRREKIAEINQQIKDLEQKNQEDIKRIKDDFNNKEAEALAAFEQKKANLKEEFAKQDQEREENRQRATRDRQLNEEQRALEEQKSLVQQLIDLNSQLAEEQKKGAKEQDPKKIADLRKQIVEVEKKQQATILNNQKKSDNAAKAAKESASAEEFNERLDALNKITDLEAQKQNEVKKLRDAGREAEAKALEDILNREIELQQKRIAAIAEDAARQRMIEEMARQKRRDDLQKEFDDERAARQVNNDKLLMDQQMAFDAQKMQLKDALAAERELFRTQRNQLVQDNAAAFNAIRNQFSQTGVAFEGLVAGIVEGSGQIGKAVLDAVKALIKTEEKTAPTTPVGSGNSSQSNNLTADNQGTNSLTFGDSSNTSTPKTSITTVDANSITVNMAGMEKILEILKKFLPEIVQSLKIDSRSGSLSNVNTGAIINELVRRELGLQGRTEENIATIGDGQNVLNLV